MPAGTAGHVFNEGFGKEEKPVGPNPRFVHHAVHVYQPDEGWRQGLRDEVIIETRNHRALQ